jgi:CheY-like chemotaxis protein
MRTGSRLPIIVVTANVRKEQLDTAIAAGAVCQLIRESRNFNADSKQDRVMQKPFKAADLVYMMKSLLPHELTPAVEPPTPGLGERSNGLVP